MIYSFISSILYASSIPISKYLTAYYSPIILSSMYYLSMSIFCFLYLTISKKFNFNLTKNELKYVFLMTISGSILAPVLMLVSIAKINAITSSLLSSFEIIFTVLIAVFFMGESKDKNFFIGFFICVFATILLGIKNGNISFNLYSFYFIVAMLFWGIDNNVTGKISYKDPVMIAFIKGGMGGIISLIISLLFEDIYFSKSKFYFVFLVGTLSYGLSLILLIISFSKIGVSKSSVLFNSYPFLAFLISIIFLNESFTMIEILSLILFALGIKIITSKKHKHFHSHLVSHSHFHLHDEHHQHHHSPIDLSKAHFHYHTHNIKMHFHEHYDDIHHKHH